MKIADCSEKKLARYLSGGGLRFVAGPFSVHLKSNAPGFSGYLRLLYGQHPLLQPPWTDIADFHLQLNAGRGIRRLWRPQAHFLLDGSHLLAPFPLDHAPPLFEWGWNFCIAGRANQFLILHNAVVAKKGRALILPGIPGSGKSTLCAALVLRGWQLLSDEFALVDPNDGRIAPLARPIALKNESIQAIRSFEPTAILGPSFPKTRKGTVAHLQPPVSSVEQMDCPVLPHWVVCPQFQQGGETVLEKLPKSHAFLRVAANAFNYETRGVSGFQSVTRIIKKCDCFDLRFTSLSAAVSILEDLVDSKEAESLP